MGANCSCGSPAINRSIPFGLCKSCYAIKVRARNRYAAQRTERYVESVDLYTVFESGGGVCAVCEQSIDPALRGPHPLSFSLDHAIPLSKGGEHSYANVRAVHLYCNNSKNARTRVSEKYSPPPADVVFEERIRTSSGTLTNGHGPLNYDVYAKLCAAHTPYTEVYRRMRKVVGKKVMGYRDWGRIFGHNWTNVERAVFLHDMQVQGMVHCGIGMQNITVLDLQEPPSEVAKVITSASQVDGDALNRFLANWTRMFRQYTSTNWIRKGLEVKLAARIIAQVGGEEAATRLARAFFNMPASMRPDEMSLRNFYNTVPRLLGIMTENETFEQERVTHDRIAAASKKDETPEEFDAVSERRRQQAEEARQLRERRENWRKEQQG